MLLAAAADNDPVLRARIHAVLACAQDRVAASGPRISMVVGVGCHRSRLEEAAGSYQEARMAADAAATLPGIGAVAFWGELGVDQVVVRLAAMGEPPVVHPGLHRLLSDPDALLLAETVETYLDVAGNAQLAAERLNLHRTSLYYRLQRIEQLAGTDLKNGLERLALHLELKVARLTGRYVPRHPVDRPPERPAAVPGAPAHLPASRLARRSVA
jgi:DNA-binding PucR family transcriptional regulator